MPRTIVSLAATLTPMLLLAAFRLWLYRERREQLGELTPAERLRIFWVGVRLDAVIVSRGCVPVVLCALFLPGEVFLPARPYILGYLGILYFFFLVLEICGLYFFRYYDCRLNHLVFEHGADREILRTIWKEYPVPRIILMSLVGAGGMAFVVFGASEGTWETGLNWDRAATLVWLLVVAIATRGTLDHRPLNPSFASITTNRIANEIASCGIFNFLTEWVHHLRGEFAALETVVPVPPLEEAVRRARSRLAARDKLTDDSANPLVRRVQGPPALRPLNVVLVVMESFTGRLVGSLGGWPALSPELDKLAREGVLLENCYATGERTIQALEAVVSSFPPLPGAGVVKRPQARYGFATLASVLKERHYATLFLYGGQGIFDQMRGFFLANGYDRFIEEKDFINPRFRSTWGVSDEDLFERADMEFRRLHERQQPFFATLLTVSLHSPWEYPSGRIRPLPSDTTVPAGFELAELENFLYADYAIGKFVRDARSAPYFDTTLFVFVGDHGVHLRGAGLVPVDEYRIPALFLCPSRLRPERIARVTSQIDLPPTIMGILGGEYRSPFFGQDVFSGAEQDPFAIVIYNKKRYGVVSNRELIVFSDSGQKLGYERHDGLRDWRQVALSVTQTQRAECALALLRVAEDLLVAGRFTAASYDDSSPKEAAES